MSTPTLQTLLSHSSFVRRTVAALGVSELEPDVLRERILAALDGEADFEREMRASEDAQYISRRLRERRRELVLALAVGDVTGAIGYEEVVGFMTRFAELAVQSVVRAHARELSRRYGVPYGYSGAPQDLLVVGMGKLGGAELNVSSDIDLIFLYDEEGETRITDDTPEARRTLSVHEFYDRLAKRIVPALNDIEGPGFVFRVDMRLRPNGDAGPIVCSSDMLEEYLYTQGRDWERFAWLKGRVVSAPVFTTPEAFERVVVSLGKLVKPFVYRKYLDYGALCSLTALHKTMRAETARREAKRAREGANVKLGRGGIREIEFIAQTLQVIRGGRSPKLCNRSTLEALKLLADDGALAAETAQKLSQSYVFLRNLEHVLQYADDQQTQWLAKSGEGLAHAAAMSGLTEAELWARYEAHRSYVADAFTSVFHLNDDEPEAQDGWPTGWYTGTSSAREALSLRLAALGYPTPVDESLLRRIEALGRGRGRQTGEAAAQRLRELLCRVLEKVPTWPRPQGCSLEEFASRFLGLLEAVSGRSTYVTLLTQFAPALERVARMLSASRWSADFLTAHPLLLDELVDERETTRLVVDAFERGAWRAELDEALAACDDDEERAMNVVRDCYHAAVFRILAADLEEKLTIEALADRLSDLADEAIAAALDYAWSHLKNRHRERPAFAVIGYGKLGAKELSYGSDLDLVFLYDDADPAADRIYGRLVRRMLSLLTLQTSSGKLFDIDLRLRPNGENGLVASSIEYFERYERNEDGAGAWFWEHQALTKARFVAGDAALGARFEALRREILAKERTLAEVRREVAAMREKMREHHRVVPGYFDVKHDTGGMVDVEFAVQGAILAFASKFPELMENLGNAALLDMTVRLGVFEKATAEAAREAYRRYRFLQHEIRLGRGVGHEARVEASVYAEDRAAVTRLWQAFLGEAALESHSHD